MQKHTIVQGLLSASLITFISSTHINNAHAQESVSNYEQSLINKSESVTQTQPANALTATSANFDMEELTKELKTRGWNIQHETDGSLILTPRQSSDNVSDNSSDKKADKNTLVNDQWQLLQQKFQNAGWSAVLDADGAMRLTPPPTAPATESEESSHTIGSNEDNSFKDMQQKLKESGWNISNNSDGSVLLYPPKRNPSKKAVAKKLHPCPGIKPTVEVSLPVNSWQEAHDIAQGWLRNESIAHSTVGKIRKIFNIYIISIVSNKAPFVLMHQIAIRSSSGAVIILN